MRPNSAPKVCWIAKIAKSNFLGGNFKKMALLQLGLAFKAQNLKTKQDWRV